MRVTQKTIADRLGVSVSLVCRVLSGKAKEIGLADETIREVMDLAAELGYVPNLAAQTLKGKSSRTIGVVVYDFQDSFFSDLVGLLQRIVHGAGYSTVFVGFTDRQIDNQDLYPLLQRNLDAVIIVGSDLEGHIVEKLKHVPVFRIGAGMVGEPAIGFYPDEVRAARDLAGYLKLLKARKVLCLRHNSAILATRLAHMRSALAEASIDSELLVVSEKRNYEAGYWAATEYLRPDSLPDVVVCAVDLIAFGVMHGAMNRGIRIPDDLRVTGFDDIAFSRQFCPSLTTFAQPIESVVHTIIGRIEKKDYSTGVQYLHCPLRQRASC